MQVSLDFAYFVAVDDLVEFFVVGDVDLLEHMQNLVDILEIRVVGRSYPS